MVNPKTGDYTAFVPSPTGIPADPALTSHGVDQSRELAVHLNSSAIPVPVERIYSSPYYRCLQTIQPFVETVAGSPSPRYQEKSPSASSPRWAVRCDSGLVDWFGPAPFEQPQPAPLKELHDDFFPWIDMGYEAQSSGVVPRLHGESMAQLHARVAATLDHIVRQCDAEGVRSIVLCSHAATIIALGRVLTGQVPNDVETEDFGAFTCGLSVFKRRSPGSFSQQQLPGQQHRQSQAQTQAQAPGQHPQHRNVSSLQTGSPTASASPSPTASPRHVPWDDQFHTLAGEAWIGGRGVAGGWDCVVNCDCSFLSRGEERGWWVVPFSCLCVILPSFFISFCFLFFFPSFSVSRLCLFHLLVSTSYRLCPPSFLCLFPCPSMSSPLSEFSLFRPTSSVCIFKWRITPEKRGQEKEKRLARLV